MDGRFVLARQGLTLDGEHTKLAVEHGNVEGELQMAVEVMPFHYTKEQALALINGKTAE